MTNPTPATVAVPVELLEQIAKTLKFNGSFVSEASVRALLPKPTPRLVAVTPANWNGDFHYLDQKWLDAQPDLLTLLWKAIDEWPVYATDAERDDLKSRIRADLGVNE